MNFVTNKHTGAPMLSLTGNGFNINAIQIIKKFISEKISIPFTSVNGSSIFFNSGFVSNENTKYEISDGVSKISTKLRKINDNEYLILEDISSLNVQNISLHFVYYGGWSVVEDIENKTITFINSYKDRVIFSSTPTSSLYKFAYESRRGVSKNGRLAIQNSSDYVIFYDENNIFFSILTTSGQSNSIGVYIFSSDEGLVVINDNVSNNTNYISFFSMENNNSYISPEGPINASFRNESGAGLCIFPMIFAGIPSNFIFNACGHLERQQEVVRFLGGVAIIRFFAGSRVIIAYD